MVYNALNWAILPYLPEEAERFLDIGCGSGALGRHIKQAKKRYVVGVTSSKEEALLASCYLDRVIVDDLNDFHSEGLGEFDCIICSHVLEHLMHPGQLLGKLRSHLTKEGILVAALPNILYCKQRFKFMLGNFKYDESGIMDRNHLRFFDRKTARHLLQGEGYRVIESAAEGYFPVPGFHNLLPRRIYSYFDQMAAKCFPGLFGVQFIFKAVAGTLPGKR